MGVSFQAPPLCLPDFLWICFPPGPLWSALTISHPHHLELAAPMLLVINSKLSLPYGTGLCAGGMLGL